jgi:membrane associated rhomboid family serine protease
MTSTNANAVAQTPPCRPAMTFAVMFVTVTVSIVALVHAPLMSSMTRDTDKLRAGQWWRIASPVLIQSSGWGQLAFNITGLVVVGVALEKCMHRLAWSLIYIGGGIVSIAVLSAWTPNDGGAGSSDAVAALVGALAIVCVAAPSTDRAGLASQMYSVFFVAYLTGLAVGGVVPSVIAGDVAVAVLLIVRRAWSPATLNRVCLILVTLGGAVMTVERQGHGVGVAFGMTIATLVVVRKRLLQISPDAGRLWPTVTALVGVVAAAELVWVAWVHLVGITLVTTNGAGDQSTVGPISVGVVSFASCAAAAALLRWLQRHLPASSRRTWFAICTTLGVVSLAGPITAAVDATSRAGLISLHLTCATVAVALLAPAGSAQ